jgi:predicted Rossmann-fold nucleotide-binding protein
LGILNTTGYYDQLLAFIDQVVSKGFMGEWQTELVTVGQEPQKLLQLLVQQAGMSLPVRTDLI